MSYNSKLLYAVLLLLTCGCTRDPFNREPLPILTNPDPLALRDCFARAVPQCFTSEDVVIFQPPFRDDLVLFGVSRIDRTAGTFELVALDVTGSLKLFDIAGDGSTATIHYAIPPLMAHKDLLLAMAQDIHRIYFDVIPKAGAEMRIDPTIIHFSEKTHEGTVTYDFGGSPFILLEKRLNGLFGPIWRVRYYQYKVCDERAFPRDIVVDNNQFHYRIIVKNRRMDLAKEFSTLSTADLQSLCEVQSLHN